MAEDGVGSGDPAVTGKREIESSAHAVAFNRGDYGSGITGDRMHQRLSHRGECVGVRTCERGDFVKVGSNGEVVPAT